VYGDAREAFNFLCDMVGMDREDDLFIDEDTLFNRLGDDGILLCQLIERIEQEGMAVPKTSTETPTRKRIASLQNINT
jgi:hypothetical protein